ncbi:MAG TPA: electron transport complex subunit RsxC [Sedimenticola sp.]|nr:electron transport complex subunit RsxC [Sedimenticola sp.]
MHYPSATPRRLHRFHGGLHLPDNKAQSNGRPVERAALPKRLVLPLQQHIGKPAHPVVETGDRVLKGQLVARAQGLISVPIHAPSSGTVVEIGDHTVPHPSGLPAPCIVIETDGREEWADLPAPMSDFAQRDPEALRQRIREAGIVGLGGAAFPTSVKLDPPQPIHTLVINGAECEPYITCDDLLMREQAARIVAGIAILRHLTGAGECLIGIEDNKPEAIQAMTRAVADRGLEGTEVVTIPTLYPSGGEKQLIRILTGREVPSGNIPASIGIVCNNVGTAAAVADAVLEGKPLISRYLTLTGEGVAEPRNLEVLIGTPAADLIAQAGGYREPVARLIMGGPMMGFTLHDDGVPVVKASNCLLAASPAEAPDPGPALPCIRCGQCAAVCPVSLLPQQLYWYARARDLEKTQAYDLFDCIECGCCSHVCPSHIPLVQYYRYAKNESWAQEQEKRKAEQARKRHEARMARLARKEAEKKARLKKKKAALAKKPAGKAKEGAPDPKKAAIEAAMKRAAEKKARLAAEGAAPKNTDQLTDAQRRQIEQADARRRAAAEPESGGKPAEKTVSEE